MKQSGHQALSLSKGFISILGFLILIILILFGIGSYFVIQDQNAKNQPSPTPIVVPVTVDKTNINQGQILVTFKTGTTYSQAVSALQGFGLTNFTTVSEFSSDHSLTSADVFRVNVEVGNEQSSVDSLQSNSLVSRATLSYK